MTSLSGSVTMTSLTMTSQFVDLGRLDSNFFSSFLLFKGFRVRIYEHTSFLTYLRQEYCLTCAAGGVGGLRGDATGVGNPSDALENPSDNLGNPSDDFGASQISTQKKVSVLALAPVRKSLCIKISSAIILVSKCRQMNKPSSGEKINGG